MCPYQGLAAFSENDANLFFGRERSVTALLMRLRGALDGGGVVMLVGASGAGKSSQINAGLVPALARGALTKWSENWPVVIMTPGMDPLDELGGHVPELAELLDKARTARLTKDQSDLEVRDGAIPASQFASRVRTACAKHVEREAGDNGRLIIVVDQFEEAFTLCGSEEQRRLFVETLDGKHSALGLTWADALLSAC
jgi:energy-coupling factor transporter ATP-binding protein EcfA2